MDSLGQESTESSSEETSPDNSPKISDFSVYTIGDLRIYLTDNFFETLKRPDGNKVFNLIPPSLLPKVLSDENLVIFQKAFTYKDFKTYGDSYEEMKTLGDYLCTLFMAELIQEDLRVKVKYTRIAHDQLVKYSTHYKSNKPYASYFKAVAPDIGKFIRKRGNIVNPKTTDIPDNIYTDVFAAFLEAISTVVDKVTGGLGIPIASNIFRAIMYNFKPDSKFVKGSAKNIIEEIFGRDNVVEYPPKRSGVEFDKKLIVIVLPESIKSFNIRATNLLSTLLPIAEEKSENALGRLQDDLNTKINKHFSENYKEQDFTSHSASVVEEVDNIIEKIYKKGFAAVGFGGTRPAASDEAYKNLLNKLSTKHSFIYENYILISTNRFIDNYVWKNKVEKRRHENAGETLRFIVKNGGVDSEDKSKQIIELIAKGKYDRLVHSIEVDKEDNDEKNAAKEQLLDYYIMDQPVVVVSNDKQAKANLSKAGLRILMSDVFFGPVTVQGRGMMNIIPPELKEQILSDENMDTFITAWTHQSFSSYEESYQGMESMGDHRCNYFVAKRNRECLKVYGTQYSTMIQDRAIKLDSHYRSNEVFMGFLINKVDARHYIRGKFSNGIVPDKVYSDVLEALIESIYLVVEYVKPGLGTAVVWNAFRSISQDYTPDVEKYSRGTATSIISEIFSEHVNSKGKKEKSIQIKYSIIGGTAYKVTASVIKPAIDDVNKKIEGIPGLKKLSYPFSAEAIGETKKVALEKVYEGLLSVLNTYKMKDEKRPYYDLYYDASQAFIVKNYSRNEEIYAQQNKRKEFLRIVKKKSPNKDMFVWELVIYQKSKPYDVFIGESIETDHNPLLWHKAKERLLDYYLDVYPIHVHRKNVEITVKEKETNRKIEFRKLVKKPDTIVWQLISYPSTDTNSTSSGKNIQVIASTSADEDINKWYDEKISLLKEYLK